MPCWGLNNLFGKMAFSLILFFVLLLFSSMGKSAYAAQPEEGMWRAGRDGDAIFHIAPCPKTGSSSKKGDLCGWLIGLDYRLEDGPPKDVAGHSECGLQILQSFVPTVRERWEGRVLDPRSGKYYNAWMWMKNPNELKLRGYVGLPLLGKTVAWLRYNGPPVGENCRMKMDH